MTPHITNIYPNEGHTGGASIVRLLGGDFAENIRVSFGSAIGLDVRRVNHALVYVRTPVTTTADGGIVDVTVQNLDTNGDPVPGEVFTFSDGFTYSLPKLLDTDLSRLVRQLVLEMRRQVLPNTVLRRHTDYADSGEDRVQISELPGIALIGPDLLPNRVYEYSVRPVIAGSERFRVKKRPPLTVDLSFTVVGGTNNESHKLALLQSTLAFFDKQTQITINRSPTDPTKGQISYYLDFDTDGLPAVIENPNGSNVSTFTGTVLIRGVAIEGFSNTSEIPEATFAAEMVGPTPNVLSLAETEQLSPGVNEPQRKKDDQYH